MLRPRQSKKDLVALGAEKLLAAYIFASVAPGAKISVGGNFALFAPSLKRWLLVTSTSLALVWKNFGRQ